jgi:MraZ protein
METEQPPPSQPQSPRSPVKYGTYDTTIDTKRRLVLPAEVRNGMDPQRDGSAFFAFVGGNGRLWFYPKNPYLQIISQARVGLTPSDAEMKFYQVMVGNAHELEWDKQGRIILPERLLRRANLSKDLSNLPLEVSLVGMVEHYHLWPRAEWEAYSDRLNEDLGPILDGVRERGLKL